jgi:hypothetical protein
MCVMCSLYVLFVCGMCVCVGGVLVVMCASGKLLVCTLRGCNVATSLHRSRVTCVGAVM